MIILPSIRRKYMVSRIPKGATVPMSECVVTLLDRNTHEPTDRTIYTGSARTLDVLVTWEGATLAVNTDYTLSYANNVNLGPATVTVTGMGQFAGSVTKTFYIVSASSMPWDFKIEDATSIGNKSIANGAVVLPFMEGYQTGYGLLPVVKRLTNNYLCGYSVAADANGEFHVADMDFSSYAVNDGSGADSQHHFALTVSPDGKNTYWGVNGASGVFKQKSGAAFDFANMTVKSTSPDLAGVLDNTQLYLRNLIFADNGRRLFVTQPGWKVCRLSLSTPYDISTLDTSTASTQKIQDLSSNYEPLGMVFGNAGYAALVAATDNRIYQFVLDAAYDFTNAEVVSSLSVSTYLRSLAIVNGGTTLLAGSDAGIYEYSLPAQEA